MRLAIRGALATAMTLALSGTAYAQSTSTYYNYAQPSYGQIGTAIAPAATSTYQAPVTAQPTTTGSTLYPSVNSYAPQPSTTYAPQASTSYAPPAASTYAPQQVGTTYATSPSSAAAPTTSYTDTGTAYSQQPAAPAPATAYGSSAYTAAQPTYTAPLYGSAPTTPSYQTPTPTTPSYQAATPSYQTPSYTGSAYGQPLPAAPLPAAAYTPSAPTTGYTPAAPTPAAPTAQTITDTDAWSYNLARFYPAVQACLRKSVTKNPVIANIQERNNKTMMLIGEGGSSNYSTCETGLSGTVVKANSETRNLPPAFFAPLGSTFTVSPDRPFQPIVDTNQKVIGWLVRTQPANAAFGQFGQARSFDGQFIPPMMVNTAVGKS